MTSNPIENPTSLRLIITVHGIRTFGHWQERLEQMIKRRDPTVEVFNYKYGYFSVAAFVVPFLRWLVTRRFRAALGRLTLQETLGPHRYRCPQLRHAPRQLGIAWSSFPAASRGSYRDSCRQRPEAWISVEGPGR